MAMSAGPADSGDEDEIISAINTTPLVDVMLVLLIIFLITIPAIVQQVPLVLPKEANVPTQTKPENVVIAVNRDGDMFWNGKLVKDTGELFERLRPIAVMIPQPEIHIRADQNVRYEFVGKVVVTLQRASILKIGFITEPPIRG
ncbi:MAG: biopolymer transporter ExbD [Rhodospirillales bacterium]